MKAQAVYLKTKRSIHKLLSSEERQNEVVAMITAFGAVVLFIIVVYICNLLKLSYDDSRYLAGLLVLGCIVYYLVARIRQKPKDIFDTISIVIYLLCVLLSLLIIYASKSIELEVGETTAVLTLLLLPPLAYGVLSGRIAELTAPGGWSAKFREAAHKPVDHTPINDDCVENWQIIKKTSLTDLVSRMPSLKRDLPVALSLTIGRKGNYKKQTLSYYIDKLSVLDPLMTIVLLDSDGRFVASSLAATVQRILDNDADSKDFISALERSDKEFLKNEFGFDLTPIASGTSNAVALEKMRNANAISMVVTDDRHFPKGIVRRDHIIARLVSELAQSGG